MKALPWLLSAVLFLLLILQRECNTPEGCSQADTVRTVEIRFDSSAHSTDLPKPTRKGQQFHQPVATIATPTGVTYKPQPVDTAAIIRAYYSARYYEQDYRDSSLALSIRDSVYMNEITWRNLTYKITRPTIISTTTITPPVKQRAKLFIGLSASAGILPAAGPELFFLTKADHGYRAGVVAGPAGINYQFGIAWKIKIRK